MAVLPLEVKTPRLKYSPKSFREITKVIRLLQANLKLSNNKCTRLHVHIGIADPKTGFQLSFTTQSCQNLAILDIAFEKQLSELCSDVLRGLDYNGPLRKVFTSPEDHFSLAKTISIRSTRSLEEFCQVIGGPKDPRDHDINFEKLTRLRAIQHHRVSQACWYSECTSHH